MVSFLTRLPKFQTLNAFINKSNALSENIGETSFEIPNLLIERKQLDWIS